MPSTSVRRLTAFTWGYWGWGTHTSDFVRAVDAIERKRGKLPSIFVDIRFSRSVRAPGFSDGAFEKTVGTILRNRQKIGTVTWKGGLGLRNAPKRLLNRIDKALLRKYEA